MKKLLSKFTALAAITILVFLNSINANAAEDYTMKPLPKGYVTFIFDDANMPFTQDFANLFKEYGIPMCCAVPAKNVDKYGELYKVLKEIENNGGEILSHGFYHSAITSDAYPEFVEEELGKSWCHLTKLGFKINGMIEVGNGGGEATADYNMVEKIARKYYKYSNASGVSEQYKKSRRFMNWSTLEGIKGEIKAAADNNEWLILSAHNYNEISSDKSTYDTSTMREILDYIKSLEGSVEVVTWNYMYNTYGEYTGPAIPNTQAKNKLKEYEDYISRKPVTSTPSSSTKSSSQDKPTSSSQISSEIPSSNETTTENVPLTSEKNESQVSNNNSSNNSSVKATYEAPKVKKEKKNNIGLIIATASAAILAVAGIIAGVIIIIKNNKK